jgi:flagellar biosynthesis/type III secretory pathway M-ring protein FliF/YscJ
MAEAPKRTIVDRGRELLTALGPAQLLPLGALIGVLALFVGFLIWSAPSAADSMGRVLLLGGKSFTEEERNAALKAFASNPLLRGHEFRDGVISVPRALETDYMAQLAKNDALPGGLSRSLRDVFLKKPWYASEPDTQRQFQAAYQDYVSRMIESGFPRVASCQVAIAEPARTGLARAGKTKASVMLRTRDGSALPAADRTAIARFVANCVVDLTPDRVEVVGGESGGDVSDPALARGLEENPHLRSKYFYERLYERKIRDLLGNVAGLGVAVNVVVDEKRSILKETLQHGKGSPRRLESNNRSSESAGSNNPAGQPGVPPNVDPPGVAPNQGAVAAAGSTETDETSKTEFANDVTRVSEELQGFTPRAAGVTVTIPKIYTEPGKDGAAPALLPATVTQMIAALKIEGLDETAIKVEVSTLPIPEPLPAAGLDLFGLVRNHLATGLLAVLALAAVVSAGLIARRASTPEIIERIVEVPVEAPAGEAPTRGSLGLPDVPGQERGVRMEQISKKIDEIVSDNTDAASGLLRQWINDD